MGTYGVWFCGGAILTLINTIAGLFANAVQRGRIFGILGTSAPIGSLIGGTSFGAVADLAGFKTLFFSVALMIGIVPLLSFFLEDKREEQKGGNRIGLRPPKCNSKLSKSYQLLCLAALINSISVFVARMAVPIEMSRLGFSATKISMITGIGGLLTIPIALLIGLLGDNYPKKNLLVLSYFGATVASIGLALSAVYWHFLVLVCLSTICVAIGVVIGPSLVTEITTQNILGTAMAIFSANVWGGAVIGFIFTGFGLQAIGVANTFIAATFIALLGVFVLLIMKHPQKPKLNSKITK
jgi:MFS family permease